MNFKTLFTIFIVAVLSYAGLSWYYGKQLDKKDAALYEQQLKTNTLQTIYNKDIGEYQTILATKEDQLHNASVISEEQKTRIEALQKDLNAKIEQVNSLELQIAAISDSGTFPPIVVDNDTVSTTYTLNAHKDGVQVAFEIKLPDLKWKYTLKFDPLTMELYILRDKETGFKVGSIVFPNNPGIRVAKWNIFYDDDLRPWYQKIWDNIHVRVGAFGGEVTGGLATIGYNKINAGYMFIEGGTSIYVGYDIK